MGEEPEDGHADDEDEELCKGTEENPALMNLKVKLPHKCINHTEVTQLRFISLRFMSLR